MPLDQEHKKRLRGIGHGLNPVVTVAGNGLSESVLAEIERAVDDHELVKLKLAVPDREERKALVGEICRATRAELVQSIGKTILIFRRNPKAKPRLSNLQRVAKSGG